MMSQNDGMPDTQRLYAWLSTDEQGYEGVLAIPGPHDDPMPLVFGDETGARRAAGAAQVAAMIRGRPARLVMFTRAEVLDEITPM